MNFIICNRCKLIIIQNRWYNKVYSCVKFILRRPFLYPNIPLLQDGRKKLEFETGNLLTNISHNKNKQVVISIGVFNRCR